ncbi:SDR family NAD(P)-dependent oxidoreductase [Acidihalobacter prosperus]|uniref:3-hydroxyacyl-CoA dehydrogenase n=1 Tax=Acidihalobacter prosperus TaxID=160660 RepID=A0A1A6C801_9GAMM|nr:SDR family NAD(P)-dependent oxidoreductase [Acidihalobacter prosperus]OBS10674.1 3-hydroxyacyl-CoA dehydrogenase [Acidihalobacter prosperus]
MSGGASGLGFATARRLHEAGARVAVLDRDAEAVARVLREWPDILALTCDVAREDALAEALTKVYERQGRARIAVACAGVAGARRLVSREGPMPMTDFLQILHDNLFSSFNLLRLVASDMSTLKPLGRDGERGVAIMTSSIAAFDGQIGQIAYAAAKGAVAAMTLPAARELAQFGVRVLALAPGLFDTPLLDNLPSETRAALAQAMPFPRRLGDPDEFADLVLHCIGNVALNGEVIRLDGALRLPAR